MMLQGVIFISSFRYLCNFTLCLSFPSLLFLFIIFIFYLYIYIYTSFLLFFFCFFFFVFLGVRRESPSYFRVSGLRG